MGFEGIGLLGRNADNADRGRRTLTGEMQITLTGEIDNADRGNADNADRGKNSEGLRPSVRQVSSERIAKL